MSKTIFYGVMSLDGYIAGENEDMGWAEKYLSPEEDYGWMELIQSCGAILMGRKTFEFELKNAPELDRILPTYVLTEQPLRFDGVHTQNLNFIGGDLREVVESIKAKHSGHLFIGGGAMLLDTLLVMGLVDELRLFLAPDLLGGGTKFFKGSKIKSQFSLIQSRQYDSGLMEMRLEKKI
jgi:dihydrofolate reductase